MIWLYNVIFYIPLDFIKFIIRYALSGRAWDLVIEQRVWDDERLLMCMLVCYFVLKDVSCSSSPVDCLYETKGLWEGTARASVGACTKDSSRVATT